MVHLGLNGQIVMEGGKAYPSPNNPEDVVVEAKKMVSRKKKTLKHPLYFGHLNFSLRFIFFLYVHVAKFSENILFIQYFSRLPSRNLFCKQSMAKRVFFFFLNKSYAD